MKLSGRERTLIGIAVALAILVGMAKIMPASRPDWLWPDPAAARTRLASAVRLIESAEAIRARANEARALEDALTLTANAGERGTAAVSELARTALDFGLKPLELKPGVGRQKGGLWILPVQFRTRAPVAEIMALVAACKNRLPMARVMRLGLIPKEGGMVEASAMIEFLFSAPEEAGKKNPRRASPAPTAGERARIIDLLRARIAAPPAARADDWSGLARAIGAPDRAGQASEPTGPVFLGVVAVGDEVRALLGLGAESWYLARGETKAGVTLLALGSDTATVRYKGQVRYLKLASEFAVSPLDRRQP